MKVLSLVISLSFFASVSSHALLQIRGEVYDVDIDNSTYTIKEHNTGDLHVLAFKPSTTIRVDNKRYRDLSHLSIGEDVVYEKKRSRSSTQHVDVAIQAVDKENQRVTYLDLNSGESITLPYDKRAKRGLGFGNISIERLRPGQQAVLEIVRK